MNIFKWIIYFSLLGIMACNGLMPDPEIFNPGYEPDIGVFGLISADEKYEFVIVERTLKLEEYNRSYWGSQRVDTIIKNAVVEIISSHDSVQFTFHESSKNEDPSFYYGNYYDEGIYLDQQNAFKAQPGVTYTLRVQVPDGRVVTGTTRVPQKPIIIAPSNNTIIAWQAVPQTNIQWQTDPETAAYQIFFIITRKGYYYYGQYYPGYQENILDNYIVIDSPATLEDIPSYILWYPLNHSIEAATIKVMAIDRNYYDYVRSHSGFAEITGTSLKLLEGGIGMFGSVAVDSVNIVLE